MKPGDIVECVDASRYLTHGKKYTVEGGDDIGSVFVRDDSGSLIWYAASRFKLVAPDTRPRYVRRGEWWMYLSDDDDAMAPLNCWTRDRNCRDDFTRTEAHRWARATGAKVVVGRKP